MSINFLPLFFKLTSFKKLITIYPYWFGLSSTSTYSPTSHPITSTVVNICILFSKCESTVLLLELIEFYIPLSLQTYCSNHLC